MFVFACQFANNVQHFASDIHKKMQEVLKREMETLLQDGTVKPSATDLHSKNYNAIVQDHGPEMLAGALSVTRSMSPSPYDIPEGESLPRGA